MRHLLYSRGPRTPGPANLKAALGPKPCKFNQQYQHANVNQINMMLAEEVPNKTKKNQNSSLRSQVSNHVQSAASPRYKNQWGSAWRRSSLLSGFFLVYSISNQGQAQFAAWRDSLIRSKVSTRHFTYMFHIHFVSTESKPQTHGLFYCWGPRPPFQSNSPFKVNSKIVVNFIMK